MSQNPRTGSVHHTIAARMGASLAVSELYREELLPSKSKFLTKWTQKSYLVFHTNSGRVGLSGEPLPPRTGSSYSPEDRGEEIRAGSGARTPRSPEAKLQKLSHQFVDLAARRMCFFWALCCRFVWLAATGILFLATKLTLLWATDLTLGRGFDTASMPPDVLFTISGRDRNDSRSLPQVFGKPAP